MIASVARLPQFTRFANRQGNEYEWFNSIIHGELEHASRCLSLVHDITDRQRSETERAIAERELSEARERQCLALNAALIGTWDYDVRNDLVHPDEGLARVFGIEWSEVESGAPLQTFVSRIHHRDRDRVSQIIEHALSNGGAYSTQFRVNSEQGERWVHARGKVHLNESERAFRAPGALVDITERKQAEEQRQESEERLRVVTNQVPAVLWTTDRDLRLTMVTGAGLRSSDMNAETVTGLTLQQFFSTDDADFLPIAKHRTALRGESSAYTLNWRGRSFQVNVEPLREHHDESIIGTIGIALDQTDLKQAEDSLVRSEARFRALVENSHDVIALFSSTGELTYASPSIERVLGLPFSELQAQHPTESIHPDDREQARRDFQICLEQPGSVVHFTQRLKHANGSYRTIEATGTNLLNAPGVNAMVSVFRDITDRCQVEEALVESEERFKTISEGAPDSVLLYSESETAEYAHERASAHERGFNRHAVVASKIVVDATGNNHHREVASSC